MMKTTIALLGLALLAACSAEPETGPPPGEPADLEAPAYVEPTPLPELAPLPEPTEPSPTPSPEPVPEDEQMMDDADATGMTSRVDRSDEGLPAQEEVPVRE